MPHLSETEVSTILLLSAMFNRITNKNCLKNTSVIKVATMKNTDTFCYKKKLSHATIKSMSAKVNGTQRRTL